MLIVKYLNNVLLLYNNNMEYIKKTLGEKMISFKELEIAKSFFIDKGLYNNLLDLNINEIAINGKKPNFYSFRLIFNDKKEKLILYDTLDINDQMIFRDIKYLLLKYIYYEKKKENLKEYGIITDIYGSIEKPNLDIIKFTYFVNLTNFILYVFKGEVKKYNLKIGSKIYLKRDNNNYLIFDRDQQKTITEIK